MKKTTLLIIVILFIVFVLIGYLLASKVFNNYQDRKVTPTPETQESLSQNNYLVFLVDDLQSKKPGLLAIWSVLAAEIPTDNVYFVSLFPTQDLSSNEQLASLFSLRKDSTLTASSLRRFRRIFNLETEGFFIIDNASYLSLASNAGMDQLEVVTETPKTIEKVEALRSNTSEFFKTICSLFSSGAATSFFSKIDWNTTMPAHLVSDKNPDEIIGLIDQLGELPRINTCKVNLP
jgi:hypothetical protein